MRCNSYPFFLPLGQGIKRAREFGSVSLWKEFQPWAYRNTHFIDHFGAQPEHGGTRSKFEATSPSRDRGRNTCWWCTSWTRSCQPETAPPSRVQGFTTTCSSTTWCMDSISDPRPSKTRCYSQTLCSKKKEQQTAKMNDLCVVFISYNQRQKTASTIHHRHYHDQTVGKTSTCICDWKDNAQKVSTTVNETFLFSLLSKNKAFSQSHLRVEWFWWACWVK